MTVEHEESPATAEGEPAGVGPALYAKPAAAGPRPPSAGSLAKWTIGGLLILAIMTLCFGFGFGVRMATEGAASGSGASGPARAAGAPDFSVLNEIYGDIKKDYIDSNSLDANALRQGAIDGLIKAVGDAHMGYLNQASFLGEGDDVTGSFSGIGATVSQKNGDLILAPLPSTPAEKAGIKPDDVLLSVNGAPAKGWNELQAVQKIRGPRGSTVKLGIRHAGGQQEDISIQRDTINIESVHTIDLHDAAGKPVTDIGYIKIDQFTQRTPTEMQTALKNMQSKNYKGLVIDLRNDPGGVVTSVVSVAGDFIGHDPAVIVKSKDGSQQTIRPNNSALVGSMPLAVLVNHNSASAAEILSGALRDQRQAKIIGESTFGKGTENIFVPLKSDNGGISITVGRWLTPSGVSIEGTGLKPDIAATAADNEDPNGQFNAVLYRAISYLQTGS
jgi:carboxyl-terminal processing protease